MSSQKLIFQPNRIFAMFEGGQGKQETHSCNRCVLALNFIEVQCISKNVCVSVYFQMLHRLEPLLE